MQRKFNRFCCQNNMKSKIHIHHGHKCLIVVPPQMNSKAFYEGCLVKLWVYEYEIMNL
jgi:hypothetical protein